MSFKRKLALTVVLTLLTLLLLSVTLLPSIARRQAVRAITEATGRVAHIEKVSFNPFTLTISVNGLALEGDKSAPFVNVENIRVSLDSASIFKRAIIIDEVTIYAPSLSFARLAENRYSFSDIVERQSKQPKKESKSDLRYSINNISIHSGSVDFVDQAVEGGRKHSVKKLEVAIPFISNIPYLLDKYTEPRLSAVINDAAFSFGGKLKPLSQSREAIVNVNLKQLDLPRYAAYSPVKLPVELISGALTVDSDISYKISSTHKPELVIKGSLQLDQLEIDIKNKQKLLKVPQLKVSASRLEMFTKQFAFNSIQLDGIELFASRDRKGQWMFSHLLPQANKKAYKAAEKTAAPAAPPQKTSSFSLDSFQISNGSVHFNDALPAGGFKTSISEIDIDVSNLADTPAKTADYEVSMLLDREASLNADGSFSIASQSGSAALKLSGLEINKAWPYLSSFITTPVKGEISTVLDLSYNREQGLKASNASLTVKNLSTTYRNNEGFKLALLELKGAGYIQKENRATVDDIRLSNGSISLSKEADGSLSLMSLLKKDSSSAPQKPSKPAVKKTAKQDHPLSWSIKRFQLDRFNASFTDRSRPENPNFILSDCLLNLSNIKGPEFTPIGLKFFSRFNRETPLKASGQLTVQPLGYRGDVTIGNLHIRDFEDYFPETINVFIVAGTIDTAMKVDVALKNGKPEGNFEGSIGIRTLHCIDSVAEEDLLKWESLQLDKIQGTLEPFSLGIREVALNNVYSRIVVRKDGTLNLQNLVDRPEPSTPASKELPTSPKETANAVQKPLKTGKPLITIGAVTIQDGTISFTDRHLPQTFNSTFYNLGGRVSGLSSEDSRLADVDLRGNLENHSPLLITGRINPLRDDLFVDLKISFKDIELSPVTPYSGTYLGYTVEKGKLFLDLKYLIDKKQLTSENNVFIDQFTFGKKVESEKATGLPVRLAIALLKDRNGEIHLDLPVTGRTDDPKFSIWGVVWQVVKNLITKAVTSPFALLSSMFGGNQDFSSIQFASGSGRLATAEETKLAALAKALSDRPGLKMEVKGYVDRGKDAEGYRMELLNHKIRNEKYLLLAKEHQVKEGVNVDSLQILPEESSKLLKAVYKKEKFPKPRNVIGLVKDISDDEMKKLIIANTVVGEQELQTLARERATAVVDFLVKKGGLPSERLFQKNDDIHKAPEKENTVRSRVEFNAIAQ